MKEASAMHWKTLFVTLGLLVMPASAQAAVITKAHNSHNLNLGSSWVGGVVPGPDDVAQWDTSLSSWLSLGADMTWGAIRITQGASSHVRIGYHGYVLGLDGIDGVGIDMAEAKVDATLNCPVILGSDQTWDVGSRQLTVGDLGGNFHLIKSGSGSLVFNGGATHGGGTTLLEGTLIIRARLQGDVVNDGFVIFDLSSDSWYQGAISGTGGLRKSGSGTLTLGGTNTYLGPTFVTGGTLQLDSDTALPIGTTLSLTGGRLDLNGFNATVSGLSGTLPIALGAGTLTVDTTSDNQFYGVISGSGALVKSGSGTLTLFQDNPYTGSTTILAGTLQLGDSAVGGRIRGNVINHGVLRVSRFGTITLDGSISGTGDLVVEHGSTRMILGEANTYTGATIISAGLLRITQPDALPGGTAATGGTSNLVIGNGLLELGAGVDFYRGLGLSPEQVQFTGSGGFSARGGTVVVNLGGASEVVTWGSGGFVPDGAALKLHASDTGVIDFQNPINLGDSPGAIDVGNLQTAWISGDIHGDAELIKTGRGRLVLTAENTYAGGTTIVEGSLQLGNGGPGGSILGDVLNNGSLTFQRSDDYTFLGMISGSGQVVQSGTGTTTLTAANTYQGWTYANGGTLRLGRSQAVPQTSQVIVNAAGTWDLAGFEQTTNYLSGSGRVTLGDGTLTLLGGSFTGTIDGPGRLVKSGTAPLTLGGDNTYTGGTIVESGILYLGSPGSPFPSTGSVLGDIVNYGRVTIGRAGEYTLPNAILGPGDLVINGSTVIIDRPQSYTGQTWVRGHYSGARLRVAHPEAVPGGLATTGGQSNLYFSHSGVLELAAGDFTRGLGDGPHQVQWEPAGGSGGFAAYGDDRAVNIGGQAETLTWGTGGFVPNNGSLIFGSENATHAIEFLNSIDLGAGQRTIRVLDGPALVEARLHAPISGDGGLILPGAGLLDMTVPNTYAGSTTLQRGVLRLSHPQALPGGIGVAGGTSNIALGTIYGGYAVIELAADDFLRGLGSGPAQVQFTSSGGFSARGADRFVDLGGESAPVGWGAGGLAGALVLGSPAADATLDFRNPIELGETAGTRGVYVYDGPAEIEGRLSGILSGARGLTKIGPGTLELTAENIYMGQTAVNAGTLLVNGTYSGGGAFSVAAGAALGGNGSIGTEARPSAVTVAPRGVLAPGASVGELEVYGEVTIRGILAIELDGLGVCKGDQLHVLGQLDITEATLALDVRGPWDQSAHVIASYHMLVGTEFIEVVGLPPGYLVDYQYQGSNQIAVVVPEPSTFVLLVVGVLGVLTCIPRRRKRAG
jgi:fibronectin-binding autotransporter adhesin